MFRYRNNTNRHHFAYCVAAFTRCGPTSLVPWFSGTSIAPLSSLSSHSLRASFPSLSPIRSSKIFKSRSRCISMSNVSIPRSSSQRPAPVNTLRYSAYFCAACSSSFLISATRLAGDRTFTELAYITAQRFIDSRLAFTLQAIVPSSFS